jgi:hypothetical protein
VARFTSPDISHPCPVVLFLLTCDLLQKGKEAEYKQSYYQIYPILSSYQERSFGQISMIAIILSSTSGLMGRLSIQQGFAFTGISLHKAGWGAEGWPSSPSVPSVGGKGVIKQKLPHQRICMKWGEENGFSLPHILKNRFGANAQNETEL